jgi:hypothetical protein
MYELAVRIQLLDPAISNSDGEFTSRVYKTHKTLVYAFNALELGDVDVFLLVLHLQNANLNGAGTTSTHF